MGSAAACHQPLGDLVPTQHQQDQATTPLDPAKALAHSIQLQLACSRGGQEASSPEQTSTQAPDNGDNGDEDAPDGAATALDSSYWDASSMAPLNPTSLVSQSPVTCTYGPT